MRGRDVVNGMRLAFAVLVLASLAGCAAGPARDTTPETAQPTPTPAGTTPEPTPADATPTPPRGTPIPPAFPAGVIFRDPTTSRLQALEGGAPRVDLMPGGFDIRVGLLAQGDNQNAIRLVVGETVRPLFVQLNHVARLSLSPNASHAVVQATTAPRGAPPDQFDVFTVDMQTGATTKLSDAPYNDESPEWSPDGGLIAWSSFSPEEGIDLHLARPDGTAHRVIDDAGAIHLAFSPDGTRILDAGRMRIIDLDGNVVADLRDEALAGLRAAGYEPDTRYPGQADRGTFPLDGAFSPDGERIVFDGAAVKDGAYGVVIATMRVDGTAFEIVAGPFAVRPETTNRLNYSETNPMWR